MRFLRRRPLASRPLRVWQLYVFPLLLVGIAYWDYRELTSWEARGGIKFMNRFDATLYRLGGKWTVVGFWLGCAAFMAAMLLLWRRRQRQLAAVQARFERSASGPVAAAAAPAVAARPAPAVAARPAPAVAARPAPAPPRPSAPPEPGTTLEELEARSRHAGDDGGPRFLR